MKWSWCVLWCIKKPIPKNHNQDSFNVFGLRGTAWCGRERIEKMKKWINDIQIQTKKANTEKEITGETNRYTKEKTKLVHLPHNTYTKHNISCTLLIISIMNYLVKKQILKIDWCFNYLCSYISNYILNVDNKVFQSISGVNICYNVLLRIKNVYIVSGISIRHKYKNKFSMLRI